MKKKVCVLLLILLVATLALQGCSFLKTSKDTAITFDTQGGSAVASIQAKAGSVVHAPEPPTREYYKFGGWYTDAECTEIYIFNVMPREDITLYAKWISSSYNLTFVGNGGSGTTIDKYTIGKVVNLPDDWVRDGYRFAGWYDNAEFAGDRVESLDEKAEGDKTFYAKWIKAEKGTYVVTLNKNGGTVDREIDSYKEGTSVVLPNCTQQGYDFMGWYDNDNFEGTAVTKIATTDTGDKIFYAKWQAKSYTITFITNGGTAVPSITAPMGSEITPPTDPTKTNMIFAGWYTDKALSNVYTFSTMPYGGATLYAKWVENFVVTYMSDGKTVHTAETADGTTVLIDPLDYSFNRPYYHFDGWYEHDESKLFTAGTNVSVLANVTLHAKWTHRSFLSDGSKYSRASSKSNPIIINNRTELVKMLDYIMFDDKDTDYFFKISYVSGLQAVQNELNDAHEEMTTYIEPNYSGSVHGANVVEYKWNAPKKVSGFVPVDPEKQHILTKVKNAMGAKIPNKRDASFDNFAYKKFDKYIDVRTSDQLFYALQYGIKPIPEAGSSAELMLNKAKDILREICDDSMTDLEKSYAIFSWFTRNVYYDHAALNLGDNIDNTTIYDAWHIEGVFNNGVAVCDGIAKAYTVLAGIEGIPCIRNTSKAVAGVVEGHAWNKIYVDLDGDYVREWYNVDATWGNTAVSFNASETYEVVNMSNFLFADNAKFKKPRNATNHNDIVADTPSKVYEYLKFEQDKRSYNLYIESSNELDALAKYLHNEANSADFTGNSISLNITYKKTIYRNDKAFIDALNTKIVRYNAALAGHDLGAISTVDDNYSLWLVIDVV